MTTKIPKGETLMAIRSRESKEIVAVSISNPKAQIISPEEVIKEVANEFGLNDTEAISKELWETLVHLRAVPVWRHTHTVVQIMDADQKQGLALSLLFDEST
jgi:hypothetical protein